MNKQKNPYNTHAVTLKGIAIKWDSNLIYMPYKNIEDRKRRDKEYYLRNKDKKKKSLKDRKEYDVEYRRCNKDKLNEKQRIRHKKKYENNIGYKLAHSLRARLYKVCNLKGCSKKNRTLEYVGCTKEFLVKYIESKFLEGMSWENRSDWHIDHIIPISSFNLEIESEIHKAMNFTNLQPLWATDNIKKSNRIV